ncbi:MAG: nickel pincer cofactor biosynthesis protein LarC [Planctomycetaceae bacterium]|nr:nickel pincer cofactor biosynthesis protein LarC [Planctomycetaceae bacterium]
MHLHLDCQFGMAGDMLLAALIDAGADKDAIVAILRSTALADFEVEAERTTRGGVSAMLLDVIDTSGVTRQGKHTHDHSHDHPHDHDHAHEHGHSHDHEHGHDHEHEHSHDHSDGGHRHGPHRHLEDLLTLLETDTIVPRVRERASRIFRIMAQAEATVHGQTVDTVHFHEISGIDTAVDVIGSCIALELLDVDSISASPPSVGSGMLMCEHGIFPVPAPATLEILKSNNIPWRAGGEGERATPTGMALLAGLAETYGDSPQITVTRIGYGAGHREFDDVPNLLRVIIGKPGVPGESERPGGGKTIITEPEQEVSGEIVRVPLDEAMLPAAVAAMLPGEVAADGDRVVEFRFAVDDMTPESIGYLCERCLAAGALEAYAVAAIMKKGRPGHEVTVLATPDSAPVVVNVLWRESSTFGMRVGERSRLVLARDFRTVLVLGHEVRVKLGWLGGSLVRCQPEYEDCRNAALDSGRPLVEVYQLAARAAEKFVGGQ